MKDRILTALGIIAVVLLAMIQGQVGLTALLFVFILVGAYEVFAIRKTVYPLWMLPLSSGCVHRWPDFGGFIHVISCGIFNDFIYDFS